jgi:hypothetical protein
MSFRIHGVPDFHFYAITDGSSDVLKRDRKWRGYNPVESRKRTMTHSSISLGWTQDDTKRQP